MCPVQGRRVAARAAITRCKTGVDFKVLPNLGLLNANEHFPTVTFFDDPSVILSNSNGRYPQGLATPRRRAAVAAGQPDSLGGHQLRRQTVRDVVPGRLARHARA